MSIRTNVDKIPTLLKWLFLFKVSLFSNEFKLSPALQPKGDPNYRFFFDPVNITFILSIQCNDSLKDEQVFNEKTFMVQVVDANGGMLELRAPIYVTNLCKTYNGFSFDKFMAKEEFDLRMAP